MVPYYTAETRSSIHYWDRIGQHFSICKDPGGPECRWCQKVIPFACRQLEIGQMTKWPWMVHKLSVAEQAETVLLDPDIGSYWEWWDIEEFGQVHEEEDEWPDPKQRER